MSTRLLKVLLGAVGAAYGLFLAALVVSYVLAFRTARTDGAAAAGAALSSKEMEARERAARRRLDGLRPQGPYIVVDTGENRLYLKRGDAVVREALVSTGSGEILQDPRRGDKRWVFDTPRGSFAVKSKISNPYWVKPDWAFIEEGEPIPKKAEDRVEGGVLGDYALGFGDGFFIHGTLYTRLLGRNVTHGCVRVADEDLKAIYKQVPVGARIFIF